MRILPRSSCISTTVYLHLLEFNETLGENTRWEFHNKSWGQHPTKQQLYSHLPLILPTIQVRWARNARLCLKSKNELMKWCSSMDSNAWTHYWHGWAAKTYIHQLYTNTGYHLEDLPRVKADMYKRVERICATSMPWWCFHDSSSSESFECWWSDSSQRYNLKHIGGYTMDTQCVVSWVGRIDTHLRWEIFGY